MTSLTFKFACREIFAFLSSADFFFKINFLEKSFSNIPSKCHTVWIQIRPDLGLNCLQRLSAKNTFRQRTKMNGVDRAEKPQLNTTLTTKFDSANHEIH